MQDLVYNLPNVNLLAVALNAVLAMIIGSIWYGPLFGNLWMKGIGVDPKDTAKVKQMKKSAGPAYLQMFIGALFMSYVFAYFYGIWWSGGTADQILSGAYYGFLAWIGFAAPIIYGRKLWEHKPFKYVAIDLGYYLAVLLVFGITIALTMERWSNYIDQFYMM